MYQAKQSWVPYANLGYAYFREMELLQEAGLGTMEIIVVSTIENARFFRVEARLGSITEGKQADIIFVNSDPLKDLEVLKNPKRVMLNGEFTESMEEDPGGSG